MTNRKDNNGNSKINKSNQMRQKPEHLQKSLQDEDRRLPKGYEAARRKRFNDTLEVLRLELELDMCPKVKIVKNATDYIKQCKALQQTIFHDDIEEETNDSEQSNKDSSELTIILKLRRLIFIYKQILMEAHVTVDFVKENNHILAGFPVLQTSQENICIKKKKKLYDMFLNKLQYGTNETIESKNAATQCEDHYFSYLDAKDNRSLIETNTSVAKNLSTTTCSNMEEFTEVCLSNGEIVVGDVKNGIVTVWLPSAESVADKDVNLIANNDNAEMPVVSCVIHKETSSFVTSDYNIRKPLTTAVSECQQHVPIPSASEDDLSSTCPSRVVILPVQKNLPTPHITLVTPSPFQGPIMSTGRNGNFLKRNNQHSIILLSNVIAPCKKLKKIAPKPEMESETGVCVSKEKELTETSIVNDGNKRKCLWKTEKFTKLPKLSDTCIDQIAQSEKPISDDEDELQEISPSTLNTLVRNAVMMDIDEGGRPLENLMEFSCMVNADRSIDSVSTLDADENIVEMFSSIADSKSIITSPLASISTNFVQPHLSTSDQTHLDGVDKNSVDKPPVITNDKDNDYVSDTIILEPTVANSNYSVMSLCMPSKLGKASSPIAPQVNTSPLSPQELVKSIHDDAHSETESRKPPTIDPHSSLVNSVTEIGTSNVTIESVIDRTSSFPNIAIGTNTAHSATKSATALASSFLNSDTETSTTNSTANDAITSSSVIKTVIDPPRCLLNIFTETSTANSAVKASVGPLNSYHSTVTDMSTVNSSVEPVINHPSSFLAIVTATSAVNSALDSVTDSPNSFHNIVSETSTAISAIQSVTSPLNSYFSSVTNTSTVNSAVQSIINSPSTFRNIVTETSTVNSSTDSVTSSLSLGSISCKYLHPFSNIPIPPIGLPVLTNIPFSSGTGSHSISRISCPAVNMSTKVSEISNNANGTTTLTADDTKMYNGSSVKALPQATVPSEALNVAESTTSSTPATCISSSIFPLSSIPTYSHQFGYCPLSIPEAPTTFSFTLTTQSSASSVCKTPVNSSVPHAFNNSVTNEIQAITGKTETTSSPCSSISLFQLSSSVGKTKNDNPKLPNMQMRFTHKDTTPANEPNFKQVGVTCGSLQDSDSLTTNSGMGSVYTSLYRPPLKAGDITSTAEISHSPLPISSTEIDSLPSDMQLSDSITYSSCSLSSVLSIFSSSSFSSTSLPLIVSSVENPMPASSQLNIVEKIPGSKKKTPVQMPIERLGDQVTSKSQIEKRVDCSRPTSYESEVGKEFTMPLLPLLAYTTSSNNDLALETKTDGKFSTISIEPTEAGKKLGKNEEKKNLSDIPKSTIITHDLLNEYSIHQSNISKSKHSLIDHISSASDNNNQCRQMIGGKAYHKNNDGLEQTLHSDHRALRINNETLHTEEKEQPANSSKSESNFYTKDQYNTASKNLSNSLKEDNELFAKEVPLIDTQCLVGQVTKTESGNDSAYEARKNMDESFSSIVTDTIDKSSERSNIPHKRTSCSTTDVTLCSTKLAFECDAVFLNESVATIENKTECRKKDSTPTEIENDNDDNENSNSVAKTCDAATSKSPTKTSENIVTSVPGGAIATYQPNLRLKSYDSAAYADIRQTQSTQEQVITAGSHRNTEVTPTLQKFSPKIQTGVSTPSFSTACITPSVSVLNNSPGNAANKNQLPSDQILMYSADSHKRISFPSPNSNLPQYEQPALNHHSLSHHQSHIQQHLPSLSQQGATFQNIQYSDIFPLYTGTEREASKTSAATNNMSAMMPGCSYGQTFDYNSYYRKSSNVSRLDPRYSCHGYKQFSQNNDFLPDASILPNQLPTFSENHDELSGRGVEISPSDHVRGFSVSHLVSHSSETRKVTTQRDNVSDDKGKETTKEKSTSKKSDGKGRCSTATKNTAICSETRQRGQGRSSTSFSHCFNNKPQTKNIHNYSTEALLSSQNHLRNSHKQSFNQNYFIPPNQMYQPSYSSQQVKNLSQNAPFSYSNHERSGPPMHCNTDYNFQLHAQASSSLAPYGSNMPYMAPSYPYQNIPPSSSSMIPGDIMGAHTGAYRLPDISDQSNFHSNAAFTLPIESQDVCAGNAIGTGQSTMPARMAASEPTFGIPTPSMHYRNNASKNGTNQQQAPANVAKRPKYFDPGMIAPGVTTPTNFFDGGSLTHIPIHSFTPPCEDATSLVHGNLLSGTSRHQNNFILSHDSVMPLNGSQYQDTNVNSIAANLASNQHLQMSSISKGTPVPQIFSSNATVRSDRQMNTSSAHLSSSLANFNLTSIIPEIDSKHDGSNSTMSSSSNRQLATMGSDTISMAAYNRLPNMGTSFVSTSNAMKDSGPQVDANHRFVPTINNSMSNIFGHSHQVGLNLNTGLPIPTSTFPGMSFQPSEH